ncbi:MAG: beta-lactamase family protein, partial [Asgard group archaeon]|nr:beta-lactamase family protein [Asgard group archaeon]
LLNFNDPLSKYIPAYPNGDKILIKHLTSNTSGIVDYINELHYTVTDENVAIDSLISIFEDNPQNFEPGEMYSYCNSGWVLLAYIIEKVSGLSYAEFVNENIFRKAAMNSTYSDWDYFSIQMAKGYHKENGAFVQNAYFSPSQIIGSGNIITTIDDLYKWYTSIYKSEPNCLKFQFRFNGCFGGFRATLFINRIFNSVYIILGNYDLAPLDEIVNELDKTLMESQTNCLVENSFEKYTGYYYAGDSYYIIIDKWKDKLVFHSGSMNQPVSHDTIYSLSDNHFLCTNVFFDFKDLDSIHYNKFNVTWGCNTYSYKRANYHFNKEGANKYVGKFVLDDNRKLEISFNENDCLEVLMEGSNKMINRYTAKGTTTTNFVFSFGRLIYDSLDNSRYQSIKINIDGISFTGKRTE